MGAAAPFTGWVLGKRRLRIFVGADFSAHSEAALRWVAWLRQLGGQCRVTYLLPTLMANGPLEMSPSPSVAEMRDRTEQVQARGFRRRVRAVLGASRVRVRIEKGWTRSDAHLIQVAREERADLIVVGPHQRHGLGRIGHHSVSRGTLHYAPMSVACVPMSAAAEQPDHENTFTETEESDRCLFEEALGAHELSFADALADVRPETDVLSIFKASHIDDK